MTLILDAAMIVIRHSASRSTDEVVDGPIFRGFPRLGVIYKTFIQNVM
jgi:hypothetical protein